MEGPAVMLIKRNETPSGVGKLFFKTPGTCNVGHGHNPFPARLQPVAGDREPSTRLVLRLAGQHQHEWPFSSRQIIKPLKASPLPSRRERLET